MQTRFVPVEGIGYDLPGPLWRPVTAALRANFGRCGTLATGFAPGFGRLQQ